MILVAPGTGRENQTCSQPACLVDLFPTLIKLCSLPTLDSQTLDGVSLVPWLEDPKRVRDLPAIIVHELQHISVRDERYRLIRYKEESREGMQPIVDFLDDVGDEQPFFIWYAPFLPHTPHDSPKKYFDQYPEGSVSDYKLPYYAAITQFDDTVGELIGEIENRDLASKTLFVFVVDNGFEPRLDRPSHYTTNSKRSPFEPGHRTPILLRWDGEIKPGKREAFVSSLDLLPTSLTAAQIDFNNDVPGIDLLSDARRLTPLPKNRAIFGEIYPGDATVLGDASKDIAYRWIRQGNYKLIVPSSSNPWNNYLNTVHLFDLETDPNETVDLAEEPKYRMIRYKLREQLDAWWRP